MAIAEEQHRGSRTRTIDRVCVSVAQYECIVCYEIGETLVWC